MKRSVTGIKPSGTPHLGNYLGMIRPALALADESDAALFIADFHALTTVRDPARLRTLTIEVTATLLALGVDPDQVMLYKQSDVPEVCELTWLLSCVTAKGLMNRAHAYKAAVQDNVVAERDPDAGVTMALFDYPLLMAADILIHSAELVPVGADNRQHVEIARDIAQTFNASYGDVFTIPEPVVNGPAMLIPGTDGAKMSKNYDNVLPILAPPEELRRRIARIVTDSRPPEEPKDPETCRIFGIYKHVVDEPTATAMADRYRAGGVGYREAKAALFDALDVMFREPRVRFEELVADTGGLSRILESGAERARERARLLLATARSATGVTR